MTTSRAGASDEGFDNNLWDGTSDVAANSQHYSPEDVEKIRSLIDETSRTVAKFRKLVVAQNQGNDVETFEMSGSLDVANSVTHTDEGEFPDFSDPEIREAMMEAPDAALSSVAMRAPMQVGLSDDIDDGVLPQVTLAELLARQEDKAEGEPTAAPLVEGRPAHVDGDETLPNFFTLRLSLRYLQFRHQSGARFTEDIRNEYALLLEALAEAAVQYNAMHRSTRHHRDTTERLNKAQEELQAERENDRVRAKETGELREKYMAEKKTGIELKAELEALRNQHNVLVSEAKAEKLQKTEREKAEKERAETMSLLVAETSILRKALSEACDTIADNMSQRMIMEKLVQDLEDRVASSSAGAQKLEKYAGQD